MNAIEIETQETFAEKYAPESARRAPWRPASFIRLESEPPAGGSTDQRFYWIAVRLNRVLVNRSTMDIIDAAPPRGAQRPLHGDGIPGLFFIQGLSQFAVVDPNQQKITARGTVRILVVLTNRELYVFPRPGLRRQIGRASCRERV